MSLRFTVARRMRHHERMMQRQGEQEVREAPKHDEQPSLGPLISVLILTAPFFYLAMALMAALAGYTGAAIWIAPFIMVPAIIFITHWAFGIQRRRDVRHAK